MTVVSISTGQPQETSPVLSPQAQGVVEALREALTLAESGAVRSVFVAYVLDDGNVGGVCDGTPGDIISAVERRMHRFHTRLDTAQE